ncbi:MAG: VOC family protein, partial [Halobacteriales archaeon]|nr:VOC family protein [Halobacteriales archaeon]
DLERAKAWYADNLDLKPVEEQDDVGVAYETGNGSRFFLYPSEFAGTNKATAMAFETDDDGFDEAVKFLRGRGIEFLEFELEGMTFEKGILRGPEGMRGVWFEDSEGNILSLSNMSL